MFKIKKKGSEFIYIKIKVNIYFENKKHVSVTILNLSGDKHSLS